MPETNEDSIAPQIQDALGIIDVERVQSALKEIIQEFRSHHKNLETTVLKQPFELVEKKLIFLVSGEIQQDVFQKIKPEVLKLLRTKLKNNQVTLHVEIREDQSHHEQKLYTSSDKMNFLKKKSKAFEELQKRFGLETDF